MLKSAGKVEVVCHRGANALAPENTYPAAQHCIEWGAEWLEIDINTSSDGVMYLFHGPDLAHTTNTFGSIKDLHSREVDRLDCGAWFSPAFAGERIPRLDEFLDWLDGRINLFFDVKWAPLEAMVRLIDEAGYRNRCFFWFGRDKYAARFRAIDPGLVMKINVRTETDIDRAIEQYDAKIVEFGLNDRAPPLIDYCRQSGINSMIRYGGNETEAFESILALAPDMANIDHPDRFLRLRA